MSEISARRQIAFYDALLRARKTVLADALQQTLTTTDPKQVQREIHNLVPSDCLQILARQGIRDEYVFPAPTVIQVMPTLVGYYRLLLGLPQKTFYAPGTGMGKFKLAEQQGKLTVKRAELEWWCQVMSDALGELVRELSTTLLPRDLGDLQLLTLGQQIQGGRNNSIGQVASQGVFEAIRVLLKFQGVTEAQGQLRVTAPDGKVFLVGVSSDPDIFVREVVNGQSLPHLAIEIKGGGDGSNVHNRAGEAEKSHLKSKSVLGYPQCWTVIASANHSLKRLTQESPSTDQWFDVLQIIGQAGDSWDSFQQAFLNSLGLTVLVE